MPAIWNIKDIRSALGSEIITDNISDNIEIESIDIDSRRIAKNSLFICIKGDKNDGHDFIKDALNNGAAIVLASQIPEEFKNNQKIILVKDGINCLNKLAIFAREKSRAKIIAITGSVGKTTVKDICHFLLSNFAKSYSTYGNFNNYFGVPITLANLPKDLDFAVIEIGMNHSGEIEYLSNMIKPDIAVITTVNSAHIGNFNSETEIAKAKSEIFCGLKKDGYAIINRDNKYYQLMQDEAINYQVTTDNIVTFGFNESSDVQISSIDNIQNKLASKISILFKKNQETLSYEINSLNQAVIFNSIICVAIFKTLEININDISNLFSKITLREGRGNIMEIAKDNFKATIIDDSYNANPTSMLASINYLEEIKKINKNNAIIILGDMLELGKKELEEHIKIGNNLKNSKIDKIILVGNLMKNINQESIKNKVKYFKNSQEVADNISTIINNGDIILIKGSRAMQMEKIIEKIKNIE